MLLPLVGMSKALSTASTRCSRKSGGLFAGCAWPEATAAAALVLVSAAVAALLEVAEDDSAAGAPVLWAAAIELKKTRPIRREGEVKVRR